MSHKQRLLDKIDKQISDLVVMSQNIDWLDDLKIPDGYFYLDNPFSDSGRNLRLVYPYDPDLLQNIRTTLITDGWRSTWKFDSKNYPPSLAFEKEGHNLEIAFLDTK